MVVVGQASFGVGNRDECKGVSGEGVRTTREGSEGGDSVEVGMDRRGDRAVVGVACGGVTNKAEEEGDARRTGATGTSSQAET